MYCQCFLGATASEREIRERGYSVKNKYVSALNKIEFVVTNACTGRCKHCSEGGSSDCIDRIDPTVAADAVRKIAGEYAITTVMAFGGEPLLHPEAVFAVMQAATEMNVSRRQVITNGYFTNSADTLREVAARLAKCGVNDLLLSVDAFHQETIPLDAVRAFAIEAKGCGIPIRLLPAWLVSANDDNPYNKRTRELIAALGDLELALGEGNVVFREGNAKIYLAEYFGDTAPDNPYVEDPYDLRCVSLAANGDILGDNVYRRDILEIIENYTPTAITD